MSCYSQVLTRWPHFVLAAVFAVVIACGTLAIVIIPTPAFDNPILGFESRGTQIKGQEQVLLKLNEPEENGLSFIPPLLFKEEVFTKSLVSFSYINYINSVLNISKGAPSPAQASKVLTNDTSEGDSSGCDNIFFKPTLPKIVFASQDGGTLLRVATLRDMCTLEKKLTSSLEPSYCSHRLSITHYIELLTGKPCENLDENALDILLDLLHTCMPFYERGELTETCDEYNCFKLPRDCHANNTVYNIIHYLSDSQFFHRDANHIKYKEKLTYTLMSVANLQLDFKRYYREYIEVASLKEGNVIVKAVDSRIKFEIFNDYLLEDMVLFAVAMTVILVSMFLYLRSLVITLATVLNVIFTLVISYSLYYIVLDIKHFPFINLLTGLLCIAISADDVFIFYDTWIQMKSQYPEATPSQWMSKTMSHAALSIFVTSLTTASAFFSNVVSEITDIKCFGIFSGVSIMCNFALMITWIPCVVILLEKCVGNCCEKSRCCSCYEKFNLYLSKLNVLFERFLPFLVIKTWFIWIILLFLLGVGGIVVVFIEPRLELPTSREFQVFKSSDPMEVWDLEVKQHFRYIENDANDITTRGLPVTIVWGLKGNDNGNHLDPADNGTLEFVSGFNMTSPDAQIWMEKVCRDFKNSSMIDPTMRHVPCTISVFNDLMKVPCYAPTMAPCCGNTELPPFPDHIFRECFPKIVSAFYFILQNYLNKLPDIVTIGTPIYRQDQTDNGLAGYAMTAIGNQPWTPILDKMEIFLDELETFLEESKEDVPAGVESCWITSGFKFYDLQRALSSGTYIAIGVSVAVAFGVMLLTTFNFLISLYALFTIIMSISVTVGALVLLGWKLNILESITISLAVGLSIDFSIHYGVAYRLSESEKREKKVHESFVRVGSSVAMAAFTTFIAGAAVIPAKVLAYTQLGIFLMLVMTISWSYATLFFQSLCRIIGPKKTASTFEFCRGKVAKEPNRPTDAFGSWPPDRNSHAMQVSHISNGQLPTQKRSNGIQETNTNDPTDNKDVPTESKNGVNMMPNGSGSGAHGFRIAPFGSQIE